MATVPIFLILLSILVLVHELGHFISARIFGIKAEEFGIGLPPLAKKLFHWRGTKFTLNWLPLGGFVRLRGEELEIKMLKKIAEKKGYFWAQKCWKRGVVLSAGVAMNMILAVILFSVTYAATGIPVETDRVIIQGIESESPAEKADLKAGDQITAVTAGGQTASVGDTDKFIEIINQNLNREIIIRVAREGRALEIDVVPRSKEETPEGQGALGVVVSNLDLVHYPWWKMPFLSAWFGLKEAVLWGIDIFAGLINMLSNLIVLGRVPQDLSGPVGIASVTGKIASQGIIPLLQFTGILSVNLAIINIMPIPALDGGRLLFLIIEKLRGRPVNPKKEYWANLMGYALLIGLIILITIRDIYRLLVPS